MAFESQNGVVVRKLFRKRKDIVNPRAGSHTHLDRDIEIRQSDDQRIMVSESLQTIRKMHNNQTMMQLSTAQLLSNNSENTTRAYEVGSYTLRDAFTLGYRQANIERTTWLCCMVIISYLAYLFGMSKGENRALRANLQSQF